MIPKPCLKAQLSTLCCSCRLQGLSGPASKPSRSADLPKLSNKRNMHQNNDSASCNCLFHHTGQHTVQAKVQHHAWPVLKASISFIVIESTGNRYAAMPRNPAAALPAATCQL
jgi:hypothetical protein